MKSIKLLVFSITLNLLLAGLCGWLLISKCVSPPVQRETTTAQTNTKPAPPPVVEKPQPASFSWNQVESGDYPAYISHLRSIGCPEKTIRDIISANISNHYNQKRQELNASVEVSSQQGATYSPASYEIQAKIKSLDQEQNSLIAQLLPPAPIAPSNTLSNSTAGDAPNNAAVQATSQNNAQNSALPNPNSTTPRTEQLFTKEQQEYRAQWGWQIFYPALRDQQIQEMQQNSGQP